MTPLESAQAIVERWYSQENGKAYLVELMAAELDRRDDAAKKATQLEWYHRGKRHAKDEIRRELAELFGYKLDRQNEGGVGDE